MAVALAGALALLIGGICIAAGLARLGALGDLFSKPVRLGFLNGIALVVLVSQLPTLFGFHTDATGLYDDAEAFVRGLMDGETVIAALLVGIASLAVILVCSRWAPRLPGVFIAVVGAAAAVRVFDLTAHGVTVVGSIPSGFPSPAIPDVTFQQVRELVAGSGRHRLRDDRRHHNAVAILRRAVEAITSMPIRRSWHSAPRTSRPGSSTDSQ